MAATSFSAGTIAGVLDRVHADGRVQQEEHNADGTRLRARVSVALAASLRDFSTGNGQTS